MRVWIASLVLVLGSCKRNPVVVTDDTDDTDPRGDADLGDPCLTTIDCMAPYSCSSLLVCAEVGEWGTTPFGEDCAHTLECEAGLVCANDGSCVGPGVPGSAGIGEACAAPTDCQAGLTCYQDACDGFPVPYWEGADCPDVTGDFRVLFEIPRGPPTHGDFFRLPFPNDIRVDAAGAVSVAGMPEPGLQFGPAGNVPAAVIAGYDDAFDGFGGNQAVTFRLASLPTFDTILVGLPADNGTVALVDVTEGSPFFGVRHATGWKLTTGLPYLCDPWMTLYPSSGRPFQPGHTYAAIVTTGVLSAEGVPPIQDSDFVAMLGGAPTDPTLLAAWERYAPLRAWMADASIDPATLAAAAVFTIEDLEATGVGVRDAVRGSALPVATGLTHCTGLPGPYASPLDATRGCFDPSTVFHEVQGTLSVPVFQGGTAPFKVASDGGAASWANNQPVVLRTESLTFAMSVPTGTMPAEGWPVVLFAHDAGGNYRSFIEDGLAARLAAVAPPGGQVTGFVVISLDTWLTGPRAGARVSEWEALPGSYEPTVLYDSPLNPAAARDNRLQSAADWSQVIRWLETVDWTAGASPTESPVAFDLDHVYFVGHGLGAQAGPLFTAHEPRIQGVVLAGAGGSWIEALASVEVPFALEALVAPALADGAVNRFHPVLNLGQGMVDRTDAVNHAGLIHYFGGGQNRDLLHVVGTNDLQAGIDSQYALARAVYGEQVIQDGGAEIDRIDVTTPPVSDNVGGSTAVVLVSGGPDPHRLIFDDDRVAGQVAAFLASAVQDGRATLYDNP